MFQIELLEHIGKEDYPSLFAISEHLAKEYGEKAVLTKVTIQKYFNKPCGSFGDISTFSFYANKHITTGEGGMILTNDKNIYSQCRSLRNLCFGTKNRFNHSG